HWSSDALHHLARQAHDLHEFAVAELPGHGPEDPRPAGIVLRVDNHHGIAVELDVAAVLAAGGALGANHHRPDHCLLLDFAAGNDALDAANNDVPDARRATAGAAEHLDAHHFFGAGVVGHRHPAFLLNHGCCSLLERLLFCRSVGEGELRGRQVLD